MLSGLIEIDNRHVPPTDAAVQKANNNYSFFRIGS